MLSSESSASSGASSKCKAIKLSLLPNQKVFLILHIFYCLLAHYLLMKLLVKLCRYFFFISAIH